MYWQQFYTVFDVVDASSQVYESVRKEVTYTALHISGCNNTDARFKISIKTMHIAREVETLFVKTPQSLL